MGGTRRGGCSTRDDPELPGRSGQENALMFAGLPLWAQAGSWGLIGASSLVIGAGLAYLVKLPLRVTAGVMAFGCGVLVSAVAYDLVLEGFRAAGLWPIIVGALAGTTGYTLANWIVSR